VKRAQRLPRADDRGDELGGLRIGAVHPEELPERWRFRRTRERDERVGELREIVEWRLGIEQVRGKKGCSGQLFHPAEGLRDRPYRRRKEHVAEIVVVTAKGRHEVGRAVRALGERPSRVFA
jgi:hypothetical protein